MTDAVRDREQAVVAIMRGVAKKTGLIASVAVFALLVFGITKDFRPWWFLPLSVLFGSVLGLLNFHWLAKAVQRIYLKQDANPGFSKMAAAVMNVIKLSVIFVVLFAVIKWQLLHVFGVIAGLSLCFLAILWEGATALRDNLADRNQQ